MAGGGAVILSGGERESVIGVGRSWLHRIGTGIAAAVIVGTAVLLLWRPCLPFAAAYLLAGLLRRPHAFLLRLFRMRKKKRNTDGDARDVPRLLRGMAAVLPVLGCAVVGGGVIWLLGGLIWSELRRTLLWLADNAALVMDTVRAIGDAAASFLGTFAPVGGLSDSPAAALAEGISEVLCGMLGDLLGGLSAKASSRVGAVAAALPRILLFFAVFLLSAVYMTAEYAAVTAWIGRMIPQSLRRRWEGIRDGIGAAIGTLAAAYCKMAALTFAMLFVGLCLLGIRGALTAALIGAVVDILPLIGVGALLLPWSLFAFFCGRQGLGIGLVILYLVIAVTRQVLEPRIVGRSMGLHPLTALFALYAGGVVFGPLGMIGVPLCVSLAVRVRRAVKHGARQ